MTAPDPRGRTIAARRAAGVPWKLICRELGIGRTRAYTLLKAWEAAERGRAMDARIKSGHDEFQKPSLPGLTGQSMAAAEPERCSLNIFGLDAARLGLVGLAEFTRARDALAGEPDDERPRPMSFFAPKPSLPPVTPAPPPPTREDPAVEQARLDAQRRAAGLRRGRQATLLTGGQGVTAAPTVARAQLLGG